MQLAWSLSKGRRRQWGVRTSVKNKDTYPWFGDHKLSLWVWQFHNRVNNCPENDDLK